MPTSIVQAPTEGGMAVALEAFLQRHSDDPGSVRVTRYERIMGGYSRLMMRVWAQEGDRERAYIFRADPAPGESIVESDRAEEWALLCSLRDSGSIPMPAALWFEPLAEELGTPVIVSEMIDGPSLLTAAVARHAADHYAMGEPLCELATSIHSFDVAALPAHIERPSSWDAYIDARIRELVDGERDYPIAEPFLRMLACWLAANKPAPLPLSLVHGDFQTANVVIDPESEYRIIDWELAHVGDPREDLGWLVLCGVNQPPWLLADDPQRFFQRYAELMGFDGEALGPAAIAYFTVLGSMDVFLRMLSQVATLIRGETSSVLLAYMADAVAAMESVFMNAIATHAQVTGVQS
jgi:aminoglycoside phosphotransferase (APT) family kinase protein